MTSAYVDTGLLVKLYTPEPNSAGAIRLVQSYPVPLALTEWQELETRTALRLKAFRQETDRTSLHSNLDTFTSDISTGKWMRPQYRHFDVFQCAESLSDKFAITIGCRTLDILHVAAALAIGARDFLTSDLRQAELAQRAGLTVKSV